MRPHGHHGMVHEYRRQCAANCIEYIVVPVSPVARAVEQAVSLQNDHPLFHQVQGRRSGLARAKPHSAVGHQLRAIQLISGKRVHVPEKVQVR